MLDPDTKSQSVKRAYITFRNMDGFEHVIAAYKPYESKWSRLAAASGLLFWKSKNSGGQSEQ